MEEYEKIIEDAWHDRFNIKPTNVDPLLKKTILEIIDKLDCGELRVTVKKDNQWITLEWIKKAVLLYFRTVDNQPIHAGHTRFYDKVPLKYAQATEAHFAESGVRVVPPAHVRKGAYIAPNTVLMPSYINIGAYIDSGTLIDTWATVGSCAQIGKNVHLSGGVGIGGMLEPIQATPTIIEDNCFIGARSEIVEGVTVEHGSVISMGVFLGQSTKIYNRITGEITFGRIPAGSVVVPGSLPAADGSHSLYCAVIVKQVDERTRNKVDLNELLRWD